MSIKLPTIPLIILGSPVPKARPRTGATQHYTPKKTEDHEAKIRLLAQGWFRGCTPIPAGVAIRLDMDFLYGRPKAFKGTPERCYCPRRGSYADIDNLVKCVLDGMQEKRRKGRLINWGVFADDGQVVVQVARKLFVAQGEKPKTIITLSVVDPRVSDDPPQLTMFKQG